MIFAGFIESKDDHHMIPRIVKPKSCNIQPIRRTSRETEVVPNVLPEASQHNDLLSSGRGEWLTRPNA
jgi:hypothetical protein